MEALIQIVVEQDLDINNLQFSCESPFRNLEGVFYKKWVDVFVLVDIIYKDKRG